MQAKQFSASLDVVCKIATAAVFVLIVWATFTIILIETLPLPSKIILLSFLWLIFVFSYLLAPKKYAVDAHNLSAYSRKGFVFCWPPSEIVSVKQLSKDDLKWSWRIFGVGGLFGYYGFYYNNKYGWMTWYATQLGNYVLLELNNGKKIILTPDQPEAFIAAFSSL